MKLSRQTGTFDQERRQTDDRQTDDRKKELAGVRHLSVSVLLSVSSLFGFCKSVNLTLLLCPPPQEVKEGTR